MFENVYTDSTSGALVDSDTNYQFFDSPSDLEIDS